MVSDGMVLRKIAKKRLKTVDILISNNDFEMAVYIMGYVLEAALKAATCKTLHLPSYPAKTRDKEIGSFFATHKFDRLLMLSGLERVFSVSGPLEAYRSWSEFTSNYLGDWTSMRYMLSQTYEDKKVNRMYANLRIILKEIARRKKW